MPGFDHERLEVYATAREFNRQVKSLCAAASKGRSDLLDQLRRAAASIALNLAEGCGGFVPKEKVRFYRIARRSATECAAVLDLLADHEVIPGAGAQDAKDVLERVVAMLIALIRRLSEGDGMKK